MTQKQASLCKRNQNRIALRRPAPSAMTRLAVGLALDLHHPQGTIDCGLASRVSSVIPVYRIQLVTVTASLLHRWFDRQSIEVETAGASDEGSDLTQQLSATRSSVNRVELDIQPSIDGLSRYYQDDIDFAELIELTPVTGGDVPTVKLEQRDALPCDARHCMAAAESSLSALRRDIQSQQERLAAMMSPLGVRISTCPSMLRLILETNCWASSVLPTRSGLASIASAMIVLVGLTA